MENPQQAEPTERRIFRVLFCGHVGTYGADFAFLVVPTIRLALPDDVALHFVEVASPRELVSGMLTNAEHDLIVLMFNPRIGQSENEHVSRMHPEGDPSRENALAEAQTLPAGCDYIRAVRARTPKPILVIQNGYLVGEADGGEAGVHAAGADILVPMPFSLEHVAGQLVPFVQATGIEPHSAEDRQRYFKAGPRVFTGIVAIKSPELWRLFSEFPAYFAALPRSIDLVFLAMHEASEIVAHPLLGRADLVLTVINDLCFTGAPPGLERKEQHRWFVRELRAHTTGFLIVMSGWWGLDDLPAGRAAGADLAIALPPDLKELNAGFAIATRRWTQRLPQKSTPGIVEFIPVRKPLVVIAAGFRGARWPDIIRAIIDTRWGDDRNIQVFHEPDTSHLITHAGKASVDLFLLHATCHPPANASELGALEKLALQVKQTYACPVVACGQDLINADTWWDGLSPAGLLAALDRVLPPPQIASVDKPTRWHRLTRPPRIVMMDDLPSILEMLEPIVRAWFGDATILTFTNAEDAYQELLREDPDLFTTDACHLPPDGDELLRRLTERGAKYPVFVMSSYVTREMIRPGSIGPDLNVTFLAKPFSMDELFWHLLNQVGLRADPGSRAREVGATSDD